MKKFGIYKILLAVLILAAIYAGYFYFVGRFAEINQQASPGNTTSLVNSPDLVRIPAEPVKKDFTIHDLPERPVNPMRDKDGNIYSDSGNALGNPSLKLMAPTEPYTK